MSATIERGATRNQSAQAVAVDMAANGMVQGLLGAGFRITLGGLLNALPVIVALGDSTTAYANSLSGSAQSLVYNGNGTATIMFAAPLQGVAVGDLIGVQGCVHEEYETLVTPVLAIAGSAYTYAIAGAEPTVSPDGGTGIAVSFPYRGSGAGPASWVRALTGRRFKVINAGQIGDTLTRIIARFDHDVAVHAPERVLLSVGINDVFGAGKTLAQMQASMIAVLAKCNAIGARLDILTPFPQPIARAQWSPAKRDTFIAWRRWLARWCYANRLVCVDWAGCAAGGVQVQDPTSSNAVPMPNMCNADNIHPLVSASYLAGAAVARIYNTLYPGGASAGLAKNVTDGGLIANPLFLGSGGTAVNNTGNVTGVIANGVTVAITAGTGTATCYQTARTVAADGDLAGNWQGVSLAAVAAGDQVQIRLQNLNSQLANGDMVRVQGLVRIVSGASLVKELFFFVNSQTQISGNLLVSDLALGNSQMAPFPESFMVTMGADCPVRGPGAVHGAPTNFVPTVQFTAAGAGTFAVEVACWAVDKI